jgi:hypothetical protein
MVGIIFLLKAKKRRWLKISITALVTISIFFVCSLIASGPLLWYAPSPIFKPSISDISGIYYLSNSPADLQEKGYPLLKSDSLINFYADGTFSATNLPDLVGWMYSGNNVKYIFLMCKGTWEIKFDYVNSEWYLSLNYTELNNGSNGHEADFWLLGKKPPFSLYVNISDPDAYDWISYAKK